MWGKYFNKNCGHIWVYSQVHEGERVRDFVKWVKLYDKVLWTRFEPSSYEVNGVDDPNKKIETQNNLIFR